MMTPKYPGSGCRQGPFNPRFARLSLMAYGFVAIAVLLGGCRTGAPNKAALAASPAPAVAPSLTEEQLAEQLGMLYTRFIGLVTSATDAAMRQTDDLALRERLIRSRINAVRSFRSVVFQRNPKAAFVDTWALSVQWQVYLVEGEGKDNLGSAEPKLVEAATRLGQDIEDLGRLFLPPSQLATTKQELWEFTKANPLRPNQTTVLPSSHTARGLPQLGGLLNLPLAPFRAMEGVDKTGQSIHEVALAADRFSRVAEDMPNEMNWNMELLLLKTRGEVETMLSDLDTRQKQTQVTIQLARQTVADVNNTLARVAPILAGAERTASAVALAGQAWDNTLKTYTDMMRDLYPPKEPDPNAPKGRPFDILEYAQTVEQVSTAAVELRGLLVEFQKTVGSSAMTEQVRQLQSTTLSTVGQAETSAVQVTDHITRRVLQVIAAFFAALLVYRVVVHLLKRRGLAS